MSKHAFAATAAKRAPKTYVKVWDDPKWIRPPRTCWKQDPEPQDMSWVARKEWWERQVLSDRELTMADLRVAAYIRWRLNHEDGVAFPELRTIANDTGVAKSTVIASLTRLAARGHLYVHKRKSGKRHYANRYIAQVVVRDQVVVQLHDLMVVQLRDQGGSAAARPEPETIPETIPETKPHTQRPSDVAPTASVQRGGGSSGATEDVPFPSGEPKESMNVRQQCFWLAEQHFRHAPRSLVAKYLKEHGGDAVLSVIYGTIQDDDNDLAHALWEAFEKGMDR